MILYLILVNILFCAIKFDILNNYQPKVKVGLKKPKRFCRRQNLLVFLGPWGGVFSPGLPYHVKIFEKKFFFRVYKVKKLKKTVKKSIFVNENQIQTKNPLSRCQIFKIRVKIEISTPIYPITTQNILPKKYFSRKFLENEKNH